jgi:hypothetical protein
MMLLLVGESLTYNIEKLWHLIQVIKELQMIVCWMEQFLIQHLQQGLAKTLESSGLGEQLAQLLADVAVYGPCLLILNVLHLKHGVLAVTAMVCVSIIDANTIKALEAAIITHEQYQYAQVGNTRYVQLEYFHAKVWNA